MPVKSVGSFVTCNGDLQVPLHFDVEMVCDEVGDEIWSFLNIGSAAGHFGTDLLEHLAVAEVLDAYDVGEKCASAGESDVAEWLRSEGYTVAEPDDDMVMVPRATLEALRTVVGAAQDLLNDVD